MLMMSSTIPSYSPVIVFKAFFVVNFADILEPQEIWDITFVFDVSTGHGRFEHFIYQLSYHSE